VSDDGRWVRARKAYEQGEFLASTDERFRPVYLSNAPDGTLYVVDMYRGIIEHRISITEYLRDQIAARALQQPTGYGRIYRVVHDTSRRDTARPLGGATPAQLVDALSHPNGWWRDTAQRRLVEAGGGSAVMALHALVRDAKDPRTRLHALWTFEGIDAIDQATTAVALDDPSPAVRLAAVRIAERWMGETSGPIPTALARRLDDPDWSVRRQLAASFGAMPPGPREQTLATLLERYGNDPVVVDAALSSVRGREAALLDAVLRRAQQ
jgi:hypothetical protein